MRGRRHRLRAAVLSAGGITAVLAVAVTPATTPARAAASADPPASTSTAVSLDIPAVPGAGIAGFAGTWAVTRTGSGGGLDRAFLPGSPSPVSSYVSVTVGVSTTTGTAPDFPAAWLAETSLTRISGPSLTAGGLKLVDEFPEVHNTAKCNPPHDPLAASHITPNVVTAFGDKLVPNGPSVTATGITGGALGLPLVGTADLTFTLTSATEAAGSLFAHAGTVLTITGTLRGPGGAVTYSGRLATLTLGDVVAECAAARTLANVRILKSAPSAVTAAGTIMYTLDVFNDGPGAAADVTVSDYLNQHITTVSGLPAQCVLADGTVRCDLGTVAAGAVRRITFTAHVAPGAPVGTNIENCGTVASASPQTSEGDKESCTGTTITPLLANVSITKAGPATAQPGGPVSYTITVTNHGPGDARNEVVSDDLSGALSAITTVPAPCVLSVRTISCAIGTLAAGASRTFTVTTTVSPGAAAGTAIPNCADETTATPESDDTDNESCIQTIIGTAPPPPSTNVAITKSGPATTAPGGTVSYALTVTNHGTVDASNTVVSDVLASELTVTGVSSGCALAGQTVTCTAGTLAAGHSRTFTMAARVTAHAAAESVIENCAAAETTTPDSDLADDGSCTSATVAPAPATNVAITKAGPETALRGGQVEYTLTVTNHSSVDARGTVLGDVFVDGVTVTGIPHGCTLDGATLTCPVGSLPGGAARTFTVTATAGRHLQPGTVTGNCGTVYTSTAETDFANNGWCVQTVVSPRLPTPGPPSVPVTGLASLAGTGQAPRRRCPVASRPLIKSQVPPSPDVLPVCLVRVIVVVVVSLTTPAQSLRVFSAQLAEDDEHRSRASYLDRQHLACDHAAHCLRTGGCHTQPAADCRLTHADTRNLEIHAVPERQEGPSPNAPEQHKP